MFNGGQVQCDQGGSGVLLRPERTHREPHTRTRDKSEHSESPVILEQQEQILSSAYDYHCNSSVHSHSRSVVSTIGNATFIQREPRPVPIQRDYAVELPGFASEIITKLRFSPLEASSLIVVISRLRRKALRAAAMRKAAIRRSPLRLVCQHTPCHSRSSG